MSESGQLSSRPFLWISGLLFLVYLVNIAVGKISVLSASGSIAGIGDVAEFLVLFGSAAFFIIAVLIKEKAAESASSS